MARETKSEKLIKTAASKYHDKITIVKQDPQIRLVESRLFFAETKGLDYSGVMSDGRHIEFEVKETQVGKLPVSNIRMSQINRMEELCRMNAEVFLLVYFSSWNFWYRLEAKDVMQLVAEEYSCIPLRYFMAFGYIISNQDGWPHFLEPQRHPLAKNFIDTYPSWMPQRKNQIREVKQIISPDQTDREKRNQRIMSAMQRGLINAERQKIKVEVYKSTTAKARTEEQHGHPANKK